MKLEKFKKMKKQKKIVIGSIVGILAIIGSIALIRSYALYKEEREFNVLRGQIPDFGYDIKMVSIVVDGEKQDKIPEKPETGSYLVEVTCDKGIGKWDYKNWKLSLSEFEKETRCNVIFTTTEEKIELPNDNNIEYRTGTFIGKTGTQIIRFDTPMSGVPQYISAHPISMSSRNNWGIAHKTMIREKTKETFVTYETKIAWSGVGTESTVYDDALVWQYIAIYDPALDK